MSKLTKIDQNPVVIWSNAGTVALTAQPAANSNHWFDSNDIVASATVNSWYEIDVTDADQILFHYQSEIRDAGGFGGTATDTTHTAVCAVGLPYVNSSILTSSKPEVVRSAPPGDTNKYRGVELGQVQMDGIRSVTMEGDQTLTMVSTSIIHRSVTPAVNDTPCWSAFLAFKPSVTATTTAGGATELMSSVTFLSKIWVAFTINYAASWLASPAVGFKTEAELSYTRYAYSRPW